MKTGILNCATKVYPLFTGGALSAIDSGTLYTDEGAGSRSDFILPPAQPGLVFAFYVQNSNGLRATAASGDTIRIYNVVSAAAGYAESTTVGSMVTLASINDTEWVSVSALGTWDVV